MATGALTDSLRETLALFARGGPPQTTNEAADRLDIGRRSTYERLERLVDHGYLETKKVGASARVWWRPPSSGDERPQASPGRAPHARTVVDDVLDGADVGVLVLDDQRDVAWINTAAEQYFGVDREGVLGRDERDVVVDLIAPSIADPSAFTDRVLAADEDGASPERFECRVTAGEGREERWLEHRSRPIETGAFAGGRIELYYDVTERREAERDHPREQQVLDHVLKSSPVGIAIFSADGSVDRANDRMASLFETGGRELEDSDPEQRTLLDEDGEPLPFEERPVGRVFRTGDPVFEQEAQIEGWNGRRRWVSINAVPFPGDGDEQDRVVAVAADVTRLKEQTRQLERQRDDLKRELEDVFDRISDGFYGLDQQLRFTYVNDRAEAILGLEESSAVGRDIRDELLIDEGFEEVLLQALEEQRPVFFEDYSEPLDTWFVNAIYPSETGLSIYFRDVTDRKEREQELERYTGIIDAVGEPVYELDDRGRITFVNDPFVELTGYSESELLGEHVSAWLPDGTTDRVEAALTDLRTDDVTRSASLEYELQTKRGERVPVENRFTLLTDDAGRVRGSAGVLRDVSDRKKRERELEESERRYRTLVENFPNGTVGLFDEDLRYLTAGGEFFEEAEYSAEEIRGDRMTERLPESVAGSLEPRARAVFDGEASEFELEFWGQVRHFQILPVYDESGAVFAGMVMSQDITRRIDRERELEQRRAELAALNNLNDVIRRITDAVIERSTREEIEQAVCELLAAADSYEFAWIGDVDPASETVTSRAEAGVEGYLDDVTISVDPDDERGHGPTGRALRSGEIQTTNNAHADPEYAPWHDDIEGYRFRSSAAIPIAHEGTEYGVLNVYARRPNAFEGRERDVFGRLGEVVGHAIAATERKRALLSDEIVELEFSARGVFDSLDTDPDGRIVLEDAIPVENDEFIVYGNAEATAVEGLTALVDDIEHWTEVTVRDDGSDARFTLRLERSPILSRLATIGGTVAETVIDDGNCHVAIHVPPSADVRRITEALRETFDSARLLKRRQRSRRDEGGVRTLAVPGGELTDRQRTTLKAAYYEGYFDWPRERSGTDIASSLGVSSPTFHQHLRKAEKRVLDALFEPSSTR